MVCRYQGNGKTIVDVGEHLAEILRKQYGFNVLHITESYDLVDGVFDRAKAYDYANERLDEILKGKSRNKSGYRPSQGRN